MDRHNYEAEARMAQMCRAIKAEHAARDGDETNKKILRRVQENDPELDLLQLTTDDPYNDPDYCYCPQSNNDCSPKGSRDLERLGHYIGENTNLMKLQFKSNPFRGFNNSTIESFCRGVNSNKSIQEIWFGWTDLSGGEIFHSLRHFFENNNNLSLFEVQRCDFRAGCASQLSMALRGCKKSLKSIKIQTSQTGENASVFLGKRGENQ